MSHEPKDCTEKLLEALGDTAEPWRSSLMLKARANAYHDFKSESATPIIDLVSDLMSAARSYQAGDRRRTVFLRLAQRAKLGEFDASREDAEQWARGRKEPV